MELLIDDISEPKANKDGSMRYPGKANGQLFYFDQAVKLGERVECEIRESKYKDKFGKEQVSRWAKIKARKTSSVAGAIPFADILNVMDAILERLPQVWLTDQAIHGPRAAAQIIDTVIMGIEKGQIALPELPDEPDELDAGGSPNNHDNSPPWERG